MNPRVSEILTEMRRQRNQMGVSVQLGLMGELQALLAEEQAEAADKLARFTRVLIYFTVGLLFVGLIQIVLMLRGA